MNLCSMLGMGVLISAFSHFNTCADYFIRRPDDSNIFSKTKPGIVAVDDIMFRKSVDVGSMLFLSSEVAFSSHFHDKL